MVSTLVLYLWYYKTLFQFLAEFAFNLLYWLEKYPVIWHQEGILRVLFNICLTGLIYNSVSKNGQPSKHMHDWRDHICHSSCMYGGGKGYLRSSIGSLHAGQVLCHQAPFPAPVSLCKSRLNLYSQIKNQLLCWHRYTSGKQKPTKWKKKFFSPLF